MPDTLYSKASQVFHLNRYEQESTKGIRRIMGLVDKWKEHLPDFIDRHYPKGHPDRGIATVAITLFCLDFIEGINHNPHDHD